MVNGMFVRDFVHVARPFQSVAPRFLRDPQWLRPIVDEAVGEAAAVAHALAGGTDRRLDRPAGSPEDRAGDGFGSTRFDRGAVRSRARGLVVPIFWSNLVDVTWFPPISGDLEITPIGLSRSELVLNASYQPADALLVDTPAAEPTSSDAVRVHRVVETGVRAFLQGLAVTLETEHPGDAPR